MLAGNRRYDTVEDLPSQIPVFPLSGALLLPRAHMPLNIFEPRYMKMVDDALSGDRIVGIVQPTFEDERNEMRAQPTLCRVGGLGRLVSFQESGDGRYLISLAGICRFRIVEEHARDLPYRVCRIDCAPFASDIDGADERAVDRAAVIKAFQSFLEANDLEADWRSVQSASDEALVNTLSMMSPYGPAQKQALLEAPDLATRASTLVAITEFEIARQVSGEKSVMN